MREDDCEPEALGVLIGKTREQAQEGSVNLVERVWEAGAYVETWEAQLDSGENLGTFKCHDDLRRQRARQGGAFGSQAFGTLESGEDRLYVWEMPNTPKVSSGRD